MSNDDGKSRESEVLLEVTFRQCLEEIPPDRSVRVVDLQTFKGSGGELYVRLPEVQHVCDSDDCNGLRMYHSESTLIWSTDEVQSTILEYYCRNCGRQYAHFAIRFEALLSVSQSGRTANIVKFGQSPPFGPLTPARLITLIGPDREIFLQGRRAESRGMGIGAFAYYRRVVENQKNRIISEIAKIAAQVGADTKTMELFETAKKETRFTDSVKMIRDFLPQALLIDGENPLTLLHSALSQGLHDEGMTDGHCLLLAQSIRTVLGELAERISIVSKDDRQVKDAIKALKALPKP